ncbi:MAG: 4Fe-4S dicluster domain-containing protein [Nitrospinota bacterium]
MHKIKRLDRRELLKDGPKMFGDLFTQFAGAYIEAKDSFNEARKDAPDRADQYLDPSRGLLRPPGAVNEDLFRKLCDKCDDCIKACPENVLFRASELYGQNEGSPTFNPIRKACFLCTEFYCAKSCKTGALLLPTSPLSVKIGKARINPAKCIAQQGQECDKCLNSCPLPSPAIRLLGSVPIIDGQSCVGCGLCEHACYHSAKEKAITTLPSLL